MEHGSQRQVLDLLNTSGGRWKGRTRYPQDVGVPYTKDTWGLLKRKAERGGAGSCVQRARQEDVGRSRVVLRR